MKVFVNGVCVGTAKFPPRRRDQFGGLAFLMEGGYFVSVDETNIKSYSVGENYEIFTYG